MKLLRVIFCLLLLQLSPSLAGINNPGSASVTPPPPVPTARSELSMKPPNGGADYAFLNYFKTVSGWNYGNTSGAPSTGAIIPSELDSNGYPLSTGSFASHGGATV